MLMLILAAVAGFIAGVLVGRRNKKAVEAVVSKAESVAAQVEKKL